MVRGDVFTRSGLMPFHFECQLVLLEEPRRLVKHISEYVLVSH